MLQARLPHGFGCALLRDLLLLTNCGGMLLQHLKNGLDSLAVQSDNWSNGSSDATPGNLLRADNRGTTSRGLEDLRQSYAREAFGSMDEAAQVYLWNSLGIDNDYDPSEIPARYEPDGEDFLWEELLDAAREDGSLLSFFVVKEATGSMSKSLYVSPDWPSAEAFAKNRIASAS